MQRYPFAVHRVTFIALALAFAVVSSCGDDDAVTPGGAPPNPNPTTTGLTTTPAATATPSRITFPVDAAAATARAMLPGPAALPPAESCPTPPAPAECWEISAEDAFSDDPVGGIDDTANECTRIRAGISAVTAGSLAARAGRAQRALTATAGGANLARTTVAAQATIFDDPAVPREAVATYRRLLGGDAYLRCYEAGLKARFDDATLVQVELVQPGAVPNDGLAVAIEVNVTVSGVSAGIRTESYAWVFENALLEVALNAPLGVDPAVTIAAIVALDTRAAALARGEDVPPVDGTPGRTGTPGEDVGREESIYAVRLVVPGLTAAAAGNPCSGLAGYTDAECPVSARLRRLLAGATGTTNTLCRCQDLPALPRIGGASAKPAAYLVEVEGLGITAVTIREEGRWVVDDTYCTANPIDTGLYGGPPRPCFE